MGCGVPAISSNVSSLPEVVGDTGLSVDPLDIDALSSAMQLMAETPELRASLSEKALLRAGGFTWERCVAETAASYRRVASSSR
jgi:glycosyltransferase involved in cell wall biosynthesis